MCVCMYVYVAMLLIEVYVCVYVCTYVYVAMLLIERCMCVCMYVYVAMLLIEVYVCVYVCVIYIRTYIHTHVQVRSHPPQHYIPI
jgi:hypothetical protein